MLLRRLLAAAALAAAAFSALATPQPRDATDMWFNSGEAGWGVNIIHQGDTLFATLFVYGQDGQPRWYVASTLVGGPAVYTGGLFEATGPSFATAFDPSAVTRRQVGAMTVTIGDNDGTVDYTVDGVRITKPVTRFTFRPTNLTGLHRAYVYQASPSVRRDLERFSITDDGVRVAIDSSSDAESPCSWNGTHAQQGQIESVAGTFACGPQGASGTGNFSMRVDAAPAGFVGTFAGGSASSGRIAAALAAAPRMEGTGWRSGMWFAPGESGWGVNIIEQGDTLFATLFVYDAQGKSHWYVASDLAQQSASTADGTAMNIGPLVEATGPYFGAASFNPASVARRQVGVMSFQVRSPGVATLSYTVNNVSVTKTVNAFAFRRNDPSGSYIGQITEPAGGHDPATITIDERGGPFSMRIAGMFGGSTCDYTGTAQQVNHVIDASGTLQCGAGNSGSFVLKNLTVSADGVTGRVEITNATGFVQEGFRTFHFAAARM